MKVEYINRMEILDSGELLLGLESIGNPMYQYVYREAAGVYWDPDLKGFKSTELKDWDASQWFCHIRDIVRTGLGVRLDLGNDVLWKNISEDQILAIIAAKNT